MTVEIEAGEDSLPLLIRVSGRDRPRLTRDLLGLVASRTIRSMLPPVSAMASDTAASAVGVSG